MILSLQLHRFSHIEGYTLTASFGEGASNHHRWYSKIFTSQDSDTDLDIGNEIHYGDLVILAGTA